VYRIALYQLLQIGIVMDMIMEVLDASINPAPPFPEDEQFTAEYVNSIRAERDNLQSRLENAEMSRNSFQRQLGEIQMKVDAVRGYIADLYSMNGEIDDEIKEIAGYLDIELTKEISGTATFEISFTAQVPLDFDTDDFELSFDVSCDTYEAEDFEWNEDDTSISAEDV
jgi:transcription-repair coupling factor (superfamily II helicase)